MAAVIGLLRSLAWLNTWLARAGRVLAMAVLCLIILVIFVHVIYRILGRPIVWSDEGARLLLLWMTALSVPSVYRWGSFVAVETVVGHLPKRAAQAMGLLALALSLGVLLTSLPLSLSQVASTWDQPTVTLALPAAPGAPQAFLPFAVFYMALTTGIGLMILVNLELILSALIGPIPAKSPSDDQTTGRL